MDFSMVRDWWKKHGLPLNEVVSIYAVIVFLLYGWMLIHFLWEVPSWLYFLTVGEIFVFLSYSLFVNFMESIVLVLLILGFSLLLPGRFLRRKFVVRGSALAFLLLVWMAIFDEISAWIVPSAPEILAWGVCVVLTVPAFVFLAGRYPMVEKAVVNIVDRLIVFLYLTVPLSLLGGCVILIRLL